MLKNWKTSLAGVLAIASVIGPALTSISKGDYTAAINQLPVIITGIGLILAQDFNVKV
jgi:hypothetical protein